MKKIPLTVTKRRGLFALVDDDDFDWLNQWNWSLNTRGYAVGHIAMINGKRKAVQMHRFILNPPSHLLTHHVNGDKLDNRRENLRAVTRSENALLRKNELRSDNTTGHSGISFVSHNPTKPYMARFTLRNRNYHVGYFRSAEEAAQAIKKRKGKLNSD